MSVFKSYYVIGGYDLTGTVLDTDKFREWKWTDEGEEYICRKSKGNIQLFDGEDSMCDSHLYLGYVFASGDEEHFKSKEFNLFEAEGVAKSVEAEFVKLQEMGVIKKDSDMPAFQIIAFEECS